MAGFSPHGEVGEGLEFSLPWDCEAPTAVLRDARGAALASVSVPPTGELLRAVRELHAARPPVAPAAVPPAPARLRGTPRLLPGHHAGHPGAAAHGAG